MRSVPGHRIRFWGIVPGTGERIPRNPMMPNGAWGWDATCSCGWDSRTGGAIMAAVDRLVAEHKEDAFAEMSKPTAPAPVAPAVELESDPDALAYALAVRALPMKLRLELRQRERAGEDGKALLLEMQARDLI